MRAQFAARKDRASITSGLLNREIVMSDHLVFTHNFTFCSSLCQESRNEIQGTSTRARNVALRDRECNVGDRGGSHGRIPTSALSMRQPASRSRYRTSS